MRALRIFQVDSFTTRPFGGNPAGVVPNAHGLDERQMQVIAREMGCSETAFVSAPEIPGADYRVRFFTPSIEVPLCGHATVATFHVLCSEGLIARGTRKVWQQTGAGKLPIDLDWDENGVTVMMTQAPPEFRPLNEDPGPILNALGLSSEDRHPDYPVELGSTGLWDLLLPLRGLDAMKRISPDHHALAALNRAQGAISTHVWTFETEEPGHRVHARNLAAALDMPEDPVTGTANGALAAYLVKHDLVEPNLVTTIEVEQGYEIGRPGVVRAEVSLGPSPSGPLSVRVGGRAVTVLRGELTIHISGA